MKKSARIILIATALTTALILIAAAITPPKWERTPFQPIDVPLDSEIQEFAFYLCIEYEVDFNLIVAIIEVESGYNINAISRGGDYGLMQINKINHEWIANNLGLPDMLNPYQNIRAGVYMVSDLISKYGTISSALMAYNMGESGADALMRGGVYRTGYVDKVLEIIKELK